MKTKAYEVAGRVHKRLRGRMVQAFSFLVATAWAELFEGIFDAVVGGHDTLLSKLVYAIAFTVIAALLAEFFGDDDEEGDGSAMMMAATQ